MKISAEIFKDAYRVSKEVYEKRMTTSDGILELFQILKMNKGSAMFYITIFDHMMEGRNYTRTINVPSMEFFLKGILNDYGTNSLSNALVALKKHIEYFEKVLQVNMVKIREVYQRYLIKVNPALISNFE